MKFAVKEKKLTQTDLLLNLLSDGGWHGYREIIDLYIGNHTGRISDLRRKGHSIVGRKPKNSNAWEYQLVK